MSEKLLQIRFLDNDARGAFALTRPMQVMTAYSMTRDTIRNAERFEPTETNGLYFLVGNGKIYTGKTEQGITRIKQHAYHKDWWDRAIMFLASPKHFTSSIVNELERFSIEYLKENSPYEVMNGQDSGYRGASNFEKEMVEEIFEEAKFDLEFLGIRMTREQGDGRVETAKEDGAEKTVYEKLTDPRAYGWKAVWKDLEAFMTVGRNSDGEYIYIISKGSEVRCCSVESNKGLDRFKRKMMQDGRIVIAFEDKDTDEPDSKVLNLNEDLAVNSPSGAYAFLFGGYPNGWNVWKNDFGEKLEVLREEIENKTLV